MDDYQATVDEMVSHGVNSNQLDGVLVGAGVIGDFSKDALDVSAGLTVVTNNYAANNQTVNNEYSLLQLGSKQLDPHQLSLIRAGMSYDDARLGITDPYYVRTYTA